MTTAGATFHVEINYQDLWQFGKLVKKKNHFFLIYRQSKFYTFLVVVVDEKVEWHRWWKWEQGVGVPCSWNLFLAAGGVTQVTEAAKYFPFPRQALCLIRWNHWSGNFHALWVSPSEAAQQNWHCSFKKREMGKDLFLNTWDSWRIPVSLTSITHRNYLQQGNSSKFLVKGFPKHPKLVPAATLPPH